MDRPRLAIETDAPDAPPYPEGRNTFGLADISVCGPILMSGEELEFLLSEIPESGVYVEIGSWTASGLSWIADRRPNVRCIGVDCYEGQPSRRLLAAIVNWDVRPNVDLYLGRSEHFAWRAEADRVLVDACHLGEAVLRDLRIAAQIVKPGGKILAHDYSNVGHLGVRPAVDQFCASDGWKICGQGGSLVALVKSQ